MNFVFAVVIGAVVGAGVGYLLRQRHPRAVPLGMVAGVVGGLAASVLATIFGTAGYGWKEATLQVVLSAGAAAAAVFVVPGDVGRRPGPVDAGQP